MTWHNESRRHSLASKGIKTTINNKPIHSVPARTNRYEDAMQELSRDMKDCPDCANMRMEGLTPACCQYHLDEQQRIYDSKEKRKWDGDTSKGSPYYYARQKGASDEEAIYYAINGQFPNYVIKEVDSDGDGVPDRLDCDPDDPDKQGFFDVLKARVMQTRAVEGVNEADHDLRVANLRKEIEKREEELEAKKEAKLIKLSKETERQLYANKLKEKERELDLLQDELEEDTFKGRFKKGLRVIGSQAGILAKKGIKRVGQEAFSDKDPKTYQKVSLTKQEKAMTSSQRIEEIRKKKKQLAIIKSKKTVDTLTAKEKKLQEDIKLLQQRKVNKQ